MRNVRCVRGRELDLPIDAFVREWRFHDVCEEDGSTERNRDPILHETDRLWSLVPSQAQYHASRSQAFQSSPHQRGQCGI